MLQAGVVRLSTSITHSPGHKEGWKWVDYRKLNQVAKFNVYLMPRVED